MKKYIVIFSLLIVANFSYGQEDYKTKFKRFCGQFQTALNESVKDFPNNFENVKGEKLANKSSMTSDKYKLNTSFPEATKTYIFHNKISKRNTVVIEYVSTYNKIEAQNYYNSFKYNIPNCGIEWMGMVSDEKKGEALTQTYWLPFVEDESPYSNFVMYLKLITVPVIDKKTYKMTNQYIVAINLAAI